MAIYAIGDIQGCHDELQALLARLEFSPSRDVLYLVGDLVNRGPQSLAVLRWVRQHEGAVRPVLGNHDLHLMAVLAGQVAPKSKDTFGDLLAAPEAQDWLHWLAGVPLVREGAGHLFVHAGLLPAPPRRPGLDPGPNCGPLGTPGVKSPRRSSRGHAASGRWWGGA